MGVGEPESSGPNGLEHSLASFSENVGGMMGFVVEEIGRIQRHGTQGVSALGPASEIMLLNNGMIHIFCIAQSTATHGVDVIYFAPPSERPFVGLDVSEWEEGKQIL